MSDVDEPTDLQIESAAEERWWAEQEEVRMDRHEKCVRVEPGTVIPAGQPTKRRDMQGDAMVFESAVDYTVPEPHQWFVDSSWRPPLPDGCSCQVCGQRFIADLLVPDEVWERIKPEGKPAGSGLLCPTCIVTRIVERGIWSHATAAGDDLRPTLNLPKTPTWGIVVTPKPRGMNLPSDEPIAEVGRYHLYDQDILYRTNRDFQTKLDTIDTNFLTDFIPLTDEQVARIEAAR